LCGRIIAPNHFSHSSTLANVVLAPLHRPWVSVGGFFIVHTGFLPKQLTPDGVTSSALMRSGATMAISAPLKHDPDQTFADS